MTDDNDDDDDDDDDDDADDDNNGTGDDHSNGDNAMSMKFTATELNTKRIIPHFYLKFTKGRAPEL